MNNVSVQDFKNFSKSLNYYSLETEESKDQIINESFQLGKTAIEQLYNNGIENISKAKNQLQGDECINAIFSITQNYKVLSRVIKQLHNNNERYLHWLHKIKFQK